jgi:isopentenyl phosphate kinase
VLFTKELIIIKLGGSVITDKTKPFSIRINTIEELSKEIYEISKNGYELIIVHGGGSFGHPIAKKFNVNEGYKNEIGLKGFIKTIQAMRELNKKIVEIFNKNNVNSIGFPASTIFISNKDSIISAYLEPIIFSLNMKIIPVLCGDAVFDKSKGYTILSGDKICNYLSIHLKASKLIFTLDVDGILSFENDKPKLLKELSMNNLYSIKFKRSENIDVTGGIIYKLEEAFQVAEKGIKVFFVNGLIPGRIKKAIFEEDFYGTKILIK